MYYMLHCILYFILQNIHTVLYSVMHTVMLWAGDLNWHRRSVDNKESLLSSAHLHHQEKSHLIYWNMTFLGKVGAPRARLCLKNTNRIKLSVLGEKGSPPTPRPLPPLTLIGGWGGGKAYGGVVMRGVIWYLWPLREPIPREKPLTFGHFPKGGGGGQTRIQKFWGSFFWAFFWTLRRKGTEFDTIQKFERRWP